MKEPRRIPLTDNPKVKEPNKIPLISTSSGYETDNENHIDINYENHKENNTTSIQQLESDSIN